MRGCRRSRSSWPRADIERFLDPASLPAVASRTLDLEYLVGLGDGAVPTLVSSLPLLPESERSELERLLRVAAARRPAAGGWQSWDLDRERARALLE